MGLCTGANLDFENVTPHHMPLHLNYSIHQIQQTLEQENHVLGVFIDLSKACNTIDHCLYKRYAIVACAWPSGRVRAQAKASCIQDHSTLLKNLKILYARYPIVMRRAWPAG